MGVKISSRQDMANIMLGLIEPLKPYYSQKKAWLNLGNTSAHYPDTAAWMEGFARPLWGLGAYFGGGSQDDEWEEIYRKGIVAGTDPNSSEYWGDCVPYDQMLVEMAAISYSILWAEDTIIGGMTKVEKDNLFNWLAQINQNPCHDCNWRFFHILVNVVLMKMGREYDKEGMENSLQFIEECYDGAGWYRDGIAGPADYYIAFAIHFYSLIYATFMKKEDPKRCETYIKRALEFGKSFAYMFDESGSAIAFGRSQTYRFAQASFFSACVMAHIEPIPLGEMKGIIFRHLQYWLEKPIFDHAGVLTIGYEYPNLTMAESYNAPGSPYWGLKIFACLALNEDDLFWKADVLPLSKEKDLLSLPSADMMLQNCEDSHAVLFPAGLRIGHVHKHMEEKYSKFAYSSRYAFSVMHTPFSFSEAAPDSVLSFEIDGHIIIRRTIEDGTILEDKIISEWTPFSGIKVATEIIPTKNGHRRVHIIDSEYECIAYDSGFAVPIGDASCEVKRVQGDGEELLLRVDPNTNLICTKTDIPTVKYKIKKGRNIIETEVNY